MMTRLALMLPIVLLAVLLSAAVTADAAPIRIRIGDNMDGFGVGLHNGDAIAYDPGIGAGDGDNTDQWMLDDRSYLFSCTPAKRQARFGPVGGLHLRARRQWSDEPLPEWNDSWPTYGLCSPSARQVTGVPARLPVGGLSEPPLSDGPATDGPDTAMPIDSHVSARETSVRSKRSAAA